MNPAHPPPLLSANPKSAEYCVLRLYAARSRDLFISFAKLNRGRRGDLERCWQVMVVVALARVGRQNSVLEVIVGLLALAYLCQSTRLKSYSLRLSECDRAALDI
jgi:hypothetical protein